MPEIERQVVIDKVNSDNNLNMFYFILFLLSVGEIAKWYEGNSNSYF